jgi:hypothetical protein
LWLKVESWESNETLMTERQILHDPIHVRGVNTGRAAQGTTAFGAFGLQQVALAGARAQDFSAGRNLESLGHGFFGFNAFGTSHK